MRTSYRAPHVTLLEEILILPTCAPPSPNSSGVDSSALDRIDRLLRDQDLNIRLGADSGPALALQKRIPGGRVAAFKLGRGNIPKT